MSTGKLKAALGGRFCIIGDSHSGRTRLLRHITAGYSRTRYIATDFINSVKVSMTARVLLVNKPERELDAAGRAELSAMLRAHPGTVFFVTNDLDFIDSTATNITDPSGNTLNGGWRDFVAFSISSKILHRCKLKILPVTVFPAAPTADFAANVPVLGRFVPISAAGAVSHLLFTGPRAETAMAEVAAGIGGVAGYYNHMYDETGPLPRDYFAPMSIWGRYPVLSGPEFARLGLAAALAKSVPVLTDPTRYLTISQIFGLVEHLRGRTVIFTSCDAAFVRMMRPSTTYDWVAP